ncbi:hypothetical protein EJ06DRAFT_559537 [Trichodelitschia bisporula]|uniref:Uncharacterized protein n=1 Tax=Trichodelitschia bisporula TaxID=703511 RepID=A0A6G1HLG5_9PEZI|nr:hypothetical protein EJ06DRAFT_559537 [Trichodelitschia bisporula]
MSKHTITERHTSYGRGGAGNLRRRTEIRESIEALSVMNSPTPTPRTSMDCKPRSRASSLWSTSTGSGRRSIRDVVSGLLRREKAEGVLSDSASESASEIPLENASESALETASVTA